MSNIPHVLIVDDEPSARQTMEMLLLREGYEMHFAANGPEALEMLTQIAPDVILLDVMMPGMDGFTVCRQIKQHEIWQHIPVILVTALDSKRDLARGLDAGADDFLHKPYNSMELRARVRSMMRIKKRHDDLEAALRLREDLANMIVHDIRSPLSSITVYLDLLQNHITSDTGQQFLEAMRHESERLSAFLTDMLMMARMEHGKLALSLQAVDVGALVCAAVNGYAPIAKLKGIAFDVNVPEQAVVLAVDANLWRRVLDNLLSNAVKFSPRNGRITINLVYQDAADPAQPQLLIEVIDQGPGIPEAFQETIFDKFEIVASGRRDIKQVGLGLAFCKLVVEAHNGRISVTDNQPTGSKFVVTL